MLEYAARGLAESDLEMTTLLIGADGQMDKIRYWELKPDYRPGEIFKL